MLIDFGDLACDWIYYFNPICDFSSVHFNASLQIMLQKGSSSTILFKPVIMK